MENRNHCTLVDEAGGHYDCYSYCESGLKPAIFFWKELVSQCNERPRILIPDTLILNEKSQSVQWVFTDKNGLASKSKALTLKDFIQKITSFCSPNQLTAVIKRFTIKEGNNNCGNDVKLVNSRFLHNLTSQQLGEQLICLQKYIKSHGKHAFICRTVYNSKATHSCFLITNKNTFDQDQETENNKFLVNPTKKCRIIKSSHGKHLSETLVYLKEIVNFFKFQRGVELSELVGDFIKDQEGNWWLTNIKAFSVVEPLQNHGLLAKKIVTLTEIESEEKYQKTKICKYCDKSYLESKLTHKLNKKMLVEMDRYLLHLGKEYQWLARNDFVKFDSHSLYHEVKICERCYRLYLEIQNLIQEETKLLKRLGFQIDRDLKQLLMSLTNTKELLDEFKSREVHNLKDELPREMSLGPNSNILMRNSIPTRNDQITNYMAKYRAVIYLHEIDEVTAVKPNHNYWLEYSFFETKHKLKINCSPHSAKIDLRKLTISYFFVNPDQLSPSQVQSPSTAQFSSELDSKVLNYLQMSPSLQINLVVENQATLEKRIIGRANLDLKECLSSGGIKRSFYKFFNVEDVAYGWGLEGTIGLIRTSSKTCTSRLILSSHDKIIYLPNENYYNCEQLPEVWMDEIASKVQRISSAKGPETVEENKEAIKLKSSSKKSFSNQNAKISEEQSTDWKRVLSKETLNYEKKCFD